MSTNNLKLSNSSENIDSEEFLNFLKDSVINDKSGDSELAKILFEFIITSNVTEESVEKAREEILELAEFRANLSQKV